MATPESESGLEFVETTELIKELQKRHDDFVLIAAQDRSREFDDMTFCFRGSLHGILGLISVGELAVKNGIGGAEIDDDSLN